MMRAAGYSAAALLFAVAVGAQQDSLVALRGHVRAATDSAPLSGVSISLPGLGRQTVSDENGRFVFERVAKGRVLARARLTGFTPQDTTVIVVDDGHALELTMRPNVPELPAVAVSAAVESGPRSAQLAEFEARRARGIGRFVTAPELRTADNRTVPDVLRARMARLALEWSSTGVHAYNLSQQPPGALNHASGNAGAKCCVGRAGAEHVTVRVPAQPRAQVRGASRFPVRTSVTPERASCTPRGAAGPRPALFVF